MFLFKDHRFDNRDISYRFKFYLDIRRKMKTLHTLYNIRLVPDMEFYIGNTPITGLYFFLKSLNQFCNGYLQELPLIERLVVRDIKKAPIVLHSTPRDLVWCIERFSYLYCFLPFLDKCDHDPSKGTDCNNKHTG